MVLQWNRIGISVCLLLVCSACSSDKTGAKGLDASHLVIVGSDEKVSWDDMGKQLFGPPGADTLKLLDVSDPVSPKMVGTVLVPNSVMGPPTNVALVRQSKIALVANSRKWLPTDSGAWTHGPHTLVSIVDLEGTPKIIGTVETGQQPSGIGINPAGDLGLVANRLDGTLTVLSIHGKAVANVGTVTLGPPPVVAAGAMPPTSIVSAVAFTPDGQRALVTRIPGTQVAVVDVSGETVTYNGVDITVGKDPYNVVISTDGRIALTADSGLNGTSDGNPDTVTVIDLEANPPVQLAQLVVGDAPEGLAVSPDGTFAAVGLLNGNVVNKSLPFYHPTGIVVGLAIDGKQVTIANQVSVLGHCQGLAFSPDSKYLYAGNFLDQKISILQVQTGELVDTGKLVELGSHPASMR